MSFLYPGEYIDSTYSIDFDKLYKEGASLSSLIRPFYNKKQYISSIYFLLYEFVLVLY